MVEGNNFHLTCWSRLPPSNQVFTDALFWKCLLMIKKDTVSMVTNFTQFESTFLKLNLNKHKPCLFC